MKRRAFIFSALVALSLAACSGSSATGLDQMIYNATYIGPGTLQGTPVAAGSADPLTRPVTMAMTLSQLGQDFSGTFLLQDTLGKPAYAGSVTGRSTSLGADFTFVIPAPCAGTLYGSFTVANGELTGSATGRDCDSGPSGNNVQITFTNLVRH